jgi:hypothetical protein
LNPVTLIVMTPYHDPTGDQIEHAYFCYLADKFEADPSLLDKPLCTIERWLALDNHGATQLLRWRQLIEAAKQNPDDLGKLTAILRADDEDTRYFKGFDPFPGILSKEESRQFICISRH